MLSTLRSCGATATEDGSLPACRQAGDRGNLILLEALRKCHRE